MVFATPLLSAQPKERNQSGEKTASFEVFATSYDNYLNPLFWDLNFAGNFSLYTGIAHETISIACAKNFTQNFYWAFLFEEKITNYKWWPQNMTDESWTILLAWKDFMLKGGYYDFCYSGGKGTAQPYLYAGTNIPLDRNTLNLAIGFDVAMQFASGNKMDVFQPQGHLLASYGKDENNGLGLEYHIMGTCASAHNVTDARNAPLHHKIRLWYGKTWHILGNSQAGIHPYIFVNLNAINPTVKLNNFLPDRGSYDFCAAIPLAVKIYPGKQDFFSFTTSLKLELYYASFDHTGYDGIGGSNYAGWVPGIGVGIGGQFNLGTKCFLNFAMNFTARPEVTEDNSAHEYELKAISIHNLLESPLSISLQLRF